MRILIFLTVIFANINISIAQNVKIIGSAPTYAGAHLTIMYHEDAFTFTPKKMLDFTVNDDGKFEIQLQLDNTKLVFIPLGIYKGFLYLEPEKEYELKFPPRKDLSPAQKLNPYFEPDELMLGVANAGSNELNMLIRKLDDSMDTFINQKFGFIYRKKERSAGIAFIQQLKSEYKSEKNVFFQDYLHYRIGFLEFLANPNAFNFIEEKYFNHKEIQLNNPAYLSLYKKQYGNFLNGYFNQKEITALNRAMKTKPSFPIISALMAKYPAYANMQFREMIIATSIFDSYSRKFIGREKTLEILKDIKNSSMIEYNQNLCANYIATITHLQKNYPAPDFSIGNYKLANYKGKYLYLNFCNTQSFPCVQDFKEITKLKDRFGAQIEFLSIACDWDVTHYYDFVSKNKYSWPIIYLGNQQQLIQKYNVKAFPTYILIDPKGNIVKAPAAGPKENIQLEFIRIARDAARKALKN
ncbi:TlpA family protein disulfide reductase [Ancylomarina longa]|uniref:TlpA family protein disulfide reductase n=1 Tax=Ancylomarina longa TaxID=2487017 RepID=A0A434AXZ0_9BACT|nr:TlpA disulfide reductase family protein [Ancylomarina longa]RUT79423.1 TlpA family protein disulfide reductase [Ancylomarina longa]